MLQNTMISEKDHKRAERLLKAMQANATGFVFWGIGVAVMRGLVSPDRHWIINLLGFGICLVVYAVLVRYAHTCFVVGDILSVDEGSRPDESASARIYFWIMLMTSALYIIATDWYPTVSAMIK